MTGTLLLKRIGFFLTGKSPQREPRRWRTGEDDRPSHKPQEFPSTPAALLFRRDAGRLSPPFWSLTPWRTRRPGHEDLQSAAGTAAPLLLKLHDSVDEAVRRNRFRNCECEALRLGRAQCRGWSFHVSIQGPGSRDRNAAPDRQVLRGECRNTTVRSSLLSKHGATTL